MNHFYKLPQFSGILLCILKHFYFCRATHLSSVIWSPVPNRPVASMRTVQPTEPELCVAAEQTMKEVSNKSFQILDILNLMNSFADPFVQCNLNPCLQNPCGVNADCTNSGQRAVCKCRPNYVGDPFVSCRLEPCSTNPCGVNADCKYLLRISPT